MWWQAWRNASFSGRLDLSAVVLGLVLVLVAVAGGRGLAVVLGLAFLLVLVLPGLGLLTLGALVLAGDLAPPLAGLLAVQLEEVPVEAQVLADPLPGHQEDVADLLHEAVGEVLHLHVHPGEVAVEPVERDGAAVLAALGALPHDALVGNLLEDLGGPVPAGRADLDGPACLVVLFLVDRLRALHELGQVGELGPLVVGGLQGHPDVDAFLDDQAQLLEVLVAATLAVTAITAALVFTGRARDLADGRSDLRDRTAD